jgi:hypothetical protein
MSYSATGGRQPALLSGTRWGVGCAGAKASGARRGAHEESRKEERLDALARRNTRST